MTNSLIYNLSKLKMTDFQYYLSITLLFSSNLFMSPGMSYTTQSTTTYPKLRLISVLFRHGDRTLEKLVETYPNDPYKSYDFYPMGDGQLTNIGKGRAYQFGQVLKKMYNNFLGDIYYQPNVYAQSTAVVRCKMTMQLVLAALYPPTDIQKWNSQLPWQPTNFVYAPSEEDGSLFPLFCPSYIIAFEKLVRDPTVKLKINEYSDFMKTMSQYTGKNITTMSDLLLLYHTLATETSLGLRLPNWTKDVFPNGQLLKAALLTYDLLNYNDKLIQYSAGGLLYRIINDMNNIINGSLIDLRINLFSAHDLNMAAMLKALKIFDNQVPQFTSSVIIELREKDGDYFVQVLHYLGIPSGVKEINIPGCEKLCPYDKFIELTLSSTRMDNDPTCPLTNKSLKT